MSDKEFAKEIARLKRLAAKLKRAYEGSDYVKNVLDIFAGRYGRPAKDKSPMHLDTSKLQLFLLKSIIKQIAAKPLNLPKRKKK